uniref:Integrator complex subunit 4 n=1 Tax=Cryptomonas curvata TaxID=233186 RepID=A0A7S0QW37_9CRYP
MFVSGWGAGLMEGSRLLRERALDVVVDMLSDEIDAVRVAALEGLFQLRHVVELNEVHLQVVVGLLEDVAETLRHSTEAILAAITLTSCTGLQLVVRALLDTLTRYPTDTPQIYSALASLGARLSTLVEEVAGSFLTVDTPYLTCEPDVDDPTYVGILVLVLSAATVNTHVLSLCPSHALRHWRYLRTKDSANFPFIHLDAVGQQVLEFRVSDSNTSQGCSVDEERLLCMQRARALLRDMAALETWGRTEEAITRLRESSVSLERAASWTGGKLDAEVSLLLDHVQSVALCTDLKCFFNKAMAGENPSLDECLETAIILVDLALTIKYLYFPVSGASDHRMPQWSMRLNSLLCFALASCYSVSSRVLPDCDNTTEALKTALDQFSIFASKKAENLGIEPDEDMRVFLPSLLSTARARSSKGICGDFVEKFCPVIPDQFDALQNPSQYLVKSHAEIIRPSESSDHGVVQDFDCRLPFRMQLDLLLTNTSSPLPRLSICITCPDGSSQVVPFSVKELVVLDTLLDNGAQVSSQKNTSGLQQSIKNSNKQLSNSHSYASVPLKLSPSSGDEDMMQQKKRPNTKKITSRMIVSGWVDIEFEEAWSQAGFVHMTVIASVDAGTLEPSEVRVLKTLQGLAGTTARAKPVMAMGSSRRFLIQPVVKA